MIQLVQTKLTVQRDNVTKDKYYPKITSATVTYQYPFSVPTATIGIITNTEEATDGYISPVRVDDIIRLQVSVKHNPREKTVWETIFEGRVRDIKSTFNTKNDSKLFCTGHLAEAGSALCDLDLTYEDKDAAYIIDQFAFAAPPFLFRIGRDLALLENGAMIDYFNVSANQRYMSDVFQDLEKLAKYHYYVSCVCVYDIYGNLVAPYLRWRHFPTKLTNKYSVVEGTSRLISAEFKSSADELWNYIRVCGETVDNGEADLDTGEVTNTPTQYTGSASSLASRNKYGLRGKVITVTGIETNYMCANIAAAMVVKFRNPIISGSAKIVGTPSARIGDLVRVKIPSLEINGAYINKNYHVYKVTHTISNKGYTTSLDFTKVKKSPSDYIADYAKQARQAANNDVVTDSNTSADQDGSAEYNVTSDTSDEGDSGYTDTSTYEDNTDYTPNY
jgi:hypothetical protein